MELVAMCLVAAPVVALAQGPVGTAQLAGRSVVSSAGCGRERATFAAALAVDAAGCGGRDPDELFREIAPGYETPFDRSRPLWEARLYEGLRDGGSALFFKLHHAVADGVGGNAIFAAMTDWEREPGEEPDASVVASAAGGMPSRAR